MADESRNPQDKLNFNEFTRALKKNAEGQEATNRLVNELQGETKKEAARADKAARRAERHAAKLEARQARLTGGAAPAPLSPAEASASERSARAAQTRADAAREEAKTLPSAAEAIRLSGERAKAAIREAEAIERAARARAGAEPPRLLLPPASSIQLGPIGTYGMGEAPRTEPARAELGLLRPVIQAEQQQPDALDAQLAAQEAATSATERETQATNRQRAAVADLARDTDGLARAEANAAEGIGSSRTEMERSSVAAAQASRDFRKRGALPTEFLTALAKGQTTFRELGWQMTTTIGKFAGWTAAATAVYGVVSAIQALHRGAIDSASGVALLSRVTTTKLPGGDAELQRRFRDLSRQFNVPIADVTQAAYGTAKAFSGDLPKALQATEQALFGVKVGELSAAESTAALLSIVNGFKLSAADLPLLFDTINQSTNRFGGSAGDLVKGVGKAAGAFRNAGGTYRELIAILQTGQRTTGKTFDQIATAVQRSVSRVQTSQGAAALSAAGLDPTLKYIDLLRQASDLAQNASPQRVNQLARALIPAGGQFASTFVPILQNQELMSRVFAELSPDKAAGSSTRELENALKGVDEQLKAAVLSVEQLGSAFAQAGGLNVVLVLVKGLTEVVHLATSALDLFTRMGDLLGNIPVLGNIIYQSLLPILQVALVLKGLRRLDVAERLPAGRPGSAYARFRETLRRPPEQDLRARIDASFSSRRQLLVDRNERLSQRAAERAAETARLHRQAAGAFGAIQGTTEGTAERLAAEQRAVVTSNAYLKAQVVSNDLAEQQLFTANEINALDAQKLRYQKLIRDGSSAAVAYQQVGAQFALGALDRPSGAAPERVGGQRPAPVTQALGIVPGTFRAGGAGRVELTRLMNAEAQEARRFNAAGRKLGVAGAVLGATLRGGAGGAKIARLGIASMIRGMIAMLAALGPLDIAIIALLAVWQGLEAAQNAAKESTDRLKAARAPTADVDTLRARAEQLRRSADKRTIGRQLDFLVSDPIGFIFSSPRAETPIARRERLASEKADRDADRFAAAQAQGRLLSLRDVQASARRRLAAATSFAEIDQAIVTALQELHDSLARQEGGAQAQAAADRVEKAVAKRADEARAGLGDLGAALKLATDLPAAKALAEQFDVQRAQRGPSAKTYAGSAAQAAAAVVRSRTKPEDAAEQIKLANDERDKLVKDAMAQLDRALKRARTPRERTQARSAFTQRIRRFTDVLREQILDLPRRITGTERDLANARKEADRAEREAPFTLGGKLRAFQARSHVTELESKLSTLKGAQRELFKDFGHWDDEQRALIEDLNAFDDEQAHYETVTRYRMSQMTDRRGQADAVAQLRFQIARGRARLPAISKAKGRDEYLTALTELNQLEQQLAAEQAQKAKEDVDRFAEQLEVARSQSDIGASDEAKLSGALSDARRVLARLRATAGTDPSDIANQIKAVNSLRDQQVQSQRQEAEALISANAELARARTDDPVEEARISEREARRLERFARTQSERRNARARTIEAHKATVAAGIAQRMETIDFNLEMEKITRQEAISQLESMAKTRGITKQMRHDILSRVKALKDEGEKDTTAFNLGVGDIKLPTVYDVRRGIAQAQNAIARNAPAMHASDVAGLTASNVTNNVQVIVNDRNAAGEVYSNLDKVLRTSVRSRMRNAGMR